jgi:hypothetical protein
MKAAITFAAGLGALALAASLIGFDHWRDRPQYNTINHTCLDADCIKRGGVR